MVTGTRYFSKRIVTRCLAGVFGSEECVLHALEDWS